MSHVPGHPPTLPPFSWLSPFNLAFIPDRWPAVCILASTQRLCPVHVIAAPLVCHSLCPFITHIIHMYIIYPDLPAHPLLVVCPWRWRHYNPSRHQELEASIHLECDAIAQTAESLIAHWWCTSVGRLLCNTFWKALEPLSREVNTVLEEVRNHKHSIQEGWDPQLRCCENLRILISWTVYQQHSVTSHKTWISGWNQTFSSFLTIVKSIKNWCMT